MYQMSEQDHNNARLKTRPTIIYNLTQLPFDKSSSKLESIDYRSIRIIIEDFNKTPIDVGSLLYTKRICDPKISVNYHEKHHQHDLVDIASYKVSREVSIERLLEQLYIEKAVIGLRASTLGMRLINTRRFIEWCDNNGFEDVLDSIKSAHFALSEFIQSISHEIRIYDKSIDRGISVTTGSQRQRVAIWFLKVAFDVNEKILTQGLRLIVQSSSSVNSTEPPTNYNAGKALALGYKLFIGFHELVIYKKRFPYQLALPEESVWVFPGQLPLRTQLTKKLLTPPKHYDYEKGKIVKKYSHYSNYVRLLERHNRNTNIYSRKKFANWAINSFITLFIAVTGMNVNQLINLYWNDNFEVNKELQGFTCIKYRARNKVCEFKITSKFTKLFMKYLELRKYLLEGASYDYLFISYDNQYNTIGQINRNIITQFYSRFIHNYIDPNFPSISPRQWRAFKNNEIIRKYDLVTAAALLQHSVKTNIKNYQEGNDTQLAREFGKFFDNLSSIVITSNRNEVKQLSSPSGNCCDYGKPAPIEESPTMILPKCDTPQGCLFCNKYIIHTDEKDIRKLLSLKYIIIESAPLADSNTHFNKLYGSLLKRIDLLLSFMKETKNSTTPLIQKIEREVFELEKLDTYWASKLDILVKVGAL